MSSGVERHDKYLIFYGQSLLHVRAVSIRQREGELWLGQENERTEFRINAKMERDDDISRRA